MDYEKKDFKKLYEDIVKSEWFKRAYHDKSLGDCPFVIDELEESEDERIRKWIVDELKTCRGEHTLDGHKEFADKDSEAIAWLEKQKEQKPVEWSEEDEKNIYFLTRLIELYIKDGRYETGDGTVTKPEIIKMLKSLRPQKKWKPSEEQMVMLRAVINDPNNAGAEGCQLALRELYEQLKKLT